MRYKLLCLLIGLSLTAIPILSQEDINSTYEKKSTVSRLDWISYIEGDVRLNNRSARIEGRVIEGDELYTQEGRVEVCLDGDYLRLNHHTKIVFATLQDDSILLDVRYGEVYVQSERTIGFLTPHENFAIQGIYRIEVDRYSTQKFHNPMYEDDFDKWSYWREKEAAQERYYAEEYEEEEEPYRTIAYPYYGGISWWTWYPHWGWWPYWYWSDWYWGWHSFWYWSSWHYGWHPFWSWTNWYRYSYYPYYSNYYYRNNARLMVRKDQLKRRTPQNLGVRRIRSATSKVTTSSTGKQTGSISKSKGIKSTPSRTTVRRTSPTRTGKVKKRKLSSSQYRSTGKIYASRIQTAVKRSIKKSRSSKYTTYGSIGSRYRSSRISSRSYVPRSYSKIKTYGSYSRPSVSRSSSRSSVSRSRSSSSVSRSSSRSSARSSSGSSRSVSSGKVRKR
ncbi:MAG: hypothetical protein JSV96_10875 [Candidatus Aminicenantes bacterium]|nr:MAG: hypothetical protein JSV96_10875 [Candidatus Aminicenantes bacterium]